ncbi:formate dehydrogenase subunit gamma [Nonomuraea fuscirosea]|jgi:formate dehydrogenase subunit gamma|uniref:formate dehydrogenase subunit gamma n=1 Tax=Nonomuraea fuscirosea TaxID=1291556 RepID=UPI002DD8997F|nr:formate dehydrogenase subunit gamma [Nonomuraea fuscirosea]WSA52210.1 formate dehydrogenase subunit gamma [Nonomuraea fuscirosea]
MTSPALSFADQVRSVVARHRDDRGALLPILHSLMEELGHIDPAAIPILADELNLSRADVHGVVTFYHDFRQTPPGRTKVRICRAEACQAVGGDELVERAKSRTGVGLGETTPDGAITLEQVFCLGNCALGPSVQVGDRLYGRVGAQQLDRLLEGAA